MTAVDARRALRLEMRRRRETLDDTEQATVSMAVMTRLARLPLLRSGGPVGGYQAVRGEVDIEAALTLLAERGTSVTLPRVRGDHLEFVRWEPESDLVAGPFAIPEPQRGDLVPLRTHVAVLAPVVAFDGSGHRLGQGGGYYDRAFGGPGPRPILIGVAHAFQEVEAVPTEAWDVALDAVVTEEAVVEFTAGATDPAI
jgi:5-formyltetrahydrofolate cyclo-ligase